MAAIAPVSFSYSTRALCVKICYAKRERAMECPSCSSRNPDDSHFCRMCGNPLEGFSEVSSSHALPGYGPHRELAPGTTFAGRYEVIGELGRGGMGVIYKAEDTKLKRDVALKFLPAHATQLPEFHKRFIQEAQAAAALDHPNICVVHEIHEEKDLTFIVMAFIRGQSLKDRIAKGPCAE